MIILKIEPVLYASTGRTSITPPIIPLIRATIATQGFIIIFNLYITLIISLHIIHEIRTQIQYFFTLFVFIDKLLRV